MSEKYAGMTVNERLYISGLLHSFDKAVQEKNRDEAANILKQVEFNGAAIAEILVGFYDRS